MLLPAIPLRLSHCLFMQTELAGGGAQVSAVPEAYAQARFKGLHVSQPKLYRKGTLSGPQDWKIWERNKIWVKNSTTEDLTVVVHRVTLPIYKLVKMAVDAKASAEGAGAGVALEWVAKHRQQELVAAETLPAQQKDFEYYDLGPQADAAYVTAFPGKGLEICCVKLVARRHSIELLPPYTFKGTVAQLLQYSEQLQPAPEAAPANPGPPSSDDQQPDQGTPCCQCNCTVM